MTTRRDIERRAQRAIEQIRGADLGDAHAQEIAERVRTRLKNRETAGAESAEIGTIRGCEDYQALIPAFLSGSLAPSRALLLEEHSRTCVPCRRALSAARSGEPAERAHRPARSVSWGRWAAAAALAVLAVGTGFVVWNAGPPLPYGAVVESVGAGLYRTATVERLEPGAQIAVGEDVRVAPGQSAMLRLADGSLVEVKERSELAIESARRGTTVRVDRGSVIVEAAPQGRGRLFVSTDDCLVSVKGTIFAVSRGTRGSRVAVIEGQVRVDYAGAERTLYAGDRTATYAGGPSHGLHHELAWSQGVDRYLELVREVQALREELEDRLPRQGLRYSSRLLELAPADMVFYAAFPNLVETLVEAERIVQERIAGSEVLRQWWEANQNQPLDAHMAWMSKFSEAGSYLGEEIVITGSLGAAGELDGPVILAELLDPVGLRAWLEEMTGNEGGEVLFLEEGSVAPGEDSDDRLVVWLGSDTLIASPRADLVVRVRDGSSTDQGGSEFRSRVEEVYRDGAQTLVAVDAREIGLAIETEDDEARDRAELLGLLDASHVIFQQKRLDDRTDNTAVLAFDGPRTGAASWLAAPAPMGSLRYISPDAKLVAAAILTEPATIVDQLVAVSAEEDGSTGLRDLEESLGLSLRDDLAAALGGEMAVALDGPVVPEPAWKLIAEVYDPDRFVWAVRRAVDAANDERAREGLEPLTWTEERADGRVYHGVGGQMSLVFAFDEGYLVAAANRGLIDRAIRYRRSGHSIDSSSRFTRLLPADGRSDFSAFLFQDAMELLGPLAERIAQNQLTPEQSAALEALRGSSEPTLAYAYGEESRIVLAASGVFDLLTSGLPGMIGLGGLDLQHLMPDGDRETPSSVDT